MKKSKPRLRVKIVGFAVALLLALIVCEVLARAFFPVIHLRRSFVPGIYTPDPETGYRLLADHEGTLFEHYGEISVRTNSLGFRGPEPEVCEGSLRVLCIGDSNIFGLGVADEETLSHRLEARLREAGEDATVWNAGVPGYGTREERIVLGRLGPVLRPDVVVLGWLENDVVTALVDGPPPVRVVDGYLVANDQGLDEFRSDRRSEDFWQSSRFAQLTALQVRLWRHEKKFEKRAERQRNLVQAEENIVKSIAQVKEIAQAAEEMGAACVVVVYATRGQVVSGEKHAAVVRIEEALKTAGIPYVSLAEEFHADQQKTGRRLFVLRDLVHPNAAGNDVASAALVPLVLRLIRDR